VTEPVDLVQRIGIDISASKAGEERRDRRRIGRQRIALVYEIRMKGSVRPIGAETTLKSIYDFVEQCQGIDEDIVIFHGLVMQVIHTSAKVQRSFKIGCQA